MGRMLVFFPVAFRGVIGSAHFPADRAKGPADAQTPLARTACAIRAEITPCAAHCASVIGSVDSLDR